MRKPTRAVAVLALVLPAPLFGQATGTPSFHAPYRAFVRSEAGGTISFPNGGGTALEGQYRFGHRSFDVGIRGGLLIQDGADDLSLVGAEARARVITHTEEFPMDGAVVFGAGATFGGGTRFIFPIGLSLGRRLNIDDSSISIVPYVQPTGFLVSEPRPFTPRDTAFDVSLGFGADFRLSAVFDARISIGVGDGPEGVSVTGVWIR